MLKEGNIVKLVANKYYDSARNPIWGGKYGKIKGRITKFEGRRIIRIVVTWDNGIRKKNNKNSSNVG